MFWTVAALLAVNLAVLAASWFLLRGWIARRLAAPRQAADLEEEMGRLVTELNQAAERTVVLLEDRTAVLNELLAAADKKIGLLRREIERHEAGARVYGHLAGPRTRAAAAAGAEEPAADGPAADRAPAATPVTHAAGGAAPATGAVPGQDGAGRAAPEDPRTAAAARPSVADDPRTAAAARPSVADDPRTALRAEIGRLARGGLPAAAIAARTGAPLGEVELILSLERLSRGS
jgi:hypothetical protein